MSVSVSWEAIAICLAALAILAMLGLKNGKDNQILSSRRVGASGADNVVPIRLWQRGSTVGLLIAACGALVAIRNGELTIMLLGITCMLGPVLYRYSIVLGRNRVLPSSQQLTPQLRWH